MWAREACLAHSDFLTTFDLVIKERFNDIVNKIPII